MSSLKRNRSPKSNRILPYRNRQYVLRPISQPASLAPSLLQPLALTTSTLSVASPTTAEAIKPFPFLDLPGEIRNRIYDLVVPQTRVVISGSHPQKELEQLKSKEPTKKHKRPRGRLLGEFTGNGGRAPIDLLLICRQINQEVIQFIYARTTFCFDRIVVINKFLNIVPAPAAKSLEHLEITHIGYAEPQWTRDRVWKLRHDKKWGMMLNRIKEMIGLERLDLNFTFFDWPCRLELDEDWAKPLLNLAGEGLERVNVKLMHDRFVPKKIAATAKELETKMMSPEGKKKKLREAKLRAEMEKKRKDEARKKATKALKILLPRGNKATASNTPVKKVVKSTGLEQYSKGQAPVAFC